MSFALSLVIPLYNKQDRVRSCLQSALDQIEPFAEIILVDDGSKDASLAQIQDLVDQYAHLRLIRQANQGVSVARNTGWQAASTPYVSFLDADDALKREFSGEARRLAEACPQAWLYGFGHSMIDAQSGAFSPVQGLHEAYFGYVERYFRAVCAGPLVTSSSVMVRRQALAQVGGFPEGALLGEDLQAWTQIMLAAPDGVGCAYSGKRLAVIYQFEDQSRGQRVGKVPCIMMHFATYPQAVVENADLRAYIWRLSWLHVLGSMAQGDGAEARLRARSVRGLFGVQGWGLWALSHLPLSQPLSWIKQMRRRAGKNV